MFVEYHEAFGRFLCVVRLDVVIWKNNTTFVCSLSQLLLILFHLFDVDETFTLSTIKLRIVYSQLGMSEVPWRNVLNVYVSHVWRYYDVRYWTLGTR